MREGADRVSCQHYARLINSKIYETRQYHIHITMTFLLLKLLLKQMVISKLMVILVSETVWFKSNAIV